MIVVLNPLLYMKMDVMLNAAASAAVRDYSVIVRDMTSNSQDGPAFGPVQQRLNTWVWV